MPTANKSSSTKVDTTALTDEQIKTMLRGISIPPQPQIMVDLLIEQLDPDCSIESITKLIAQDIGLSGSILKTINSPFFNLPNKIGTIQQAISLLGVTSVINIVNSISIKSALSDDAIIKLTSLWDSATDIAEASAAISRLLNIGVPEEAYTLGLFHNCGNILMIQKFKAFPEVIKSSYAEPTKRIVDIENDELKTNHAVVGYYVAKTWKLPKKLTEAIAIHHSADPIFQNHEYADYELKVSIAILKMAEHICGNHSVLGNQDIDFEWQRLEKNLLGFLGLSQDDMESIVDKIEDLGLTGNRFIDFSDA